MFLLDTNVLAELRKGSRCAPNVAAWNALHPPAAMFVSVLTLGEIRKGIESLRSRDPAQAHALEAWHGRVVAAFLGRTLAVDGAVADAWGRMNVPLALPAIDGLLAATARTHGLTLVTRNVADFARAGGSAAEPLRRRSTTAVATGTPAPYVTVLFERIGRPPRRPRHTRHARPGAAASGCDGRLPARGVAGDGVSGSDRGDDGGRCV